MASALDWVTNDSLITIDNGRKIDLDASVPKIIIL